MSMAHGDYSVDPGAARSSLYFEIAAKLPHAGSNSKDAHPWLERCVSLLLRHAFEAASIVGDCQMQPAGDLPHVDGDP